MSINNLNKGVNLNGKVINLLMYADDLVLFSENGKNLQDMLRLFHLKVSWGGSLEAIY